MDKVLAWLAVVAILGILWTSVAMGDMWGW